MSKPDGQSQRLLGKGECERIVSTVLDSAQGGGTTSVNITSWWLGSIKWGRNRVLHSSDQRNISVGISRSVENGSRRSVLTNQRDDESLISGLRSAERASRVDMRNSIPEPFNLPPARFETPITTIYSDETFEETSAARSELAQFLSVESEKHSLLAAGYLEMKGVEYYNVSSADRSDVVSGVFTQAQCSMTVRHPKGLGSGWAGGSSFDWSAINSRKIGKVALEKCIASLNPVRIEPGRYTAILEPQAAGDLIRYMVAAMQRPSPQGAESPSHAFTLGPDQALRLFRSKLGLQVIDSRLSIEHDITDPELGVIPREGLASIKLIDRGKLVSLYYAGNVQRSRQYSLEWLNDGAPQIDRPAFRVSGGDTSIEEMIESTERGLLVTRFWGLGELDRPSLLYTGITRDGLWLIEDGKISRAVKNMRITESPLFVLNQVEQIGVALPIFRPVVEPSTIGLYPAIVPALKVRDFSFTATSDGV